MLRPAKARCDKLHFGEDDAQAARGSACTKSFARRTRTYNSWLLVAAKCRLMAQGCSTHCVSAEVFFIATQHDDIRGWQNHAISGYDQSYP